MQSSTLLPIDKPGDANESTAATAAQTPKQFTLEETLALAHQAINHANERIKIGSTQLVNSLLSSEEFESRKKAIGENKRKDFGIRQLIERKTLSFSLDGDDDLAYYENVVSVTTKYSVGNCSELAFLALDYMLHAEPDMNAEVFKIKNGDHGFLVLNRAPGSKEDSPITWGENAVICDPWAKEAYKAAEILDKLYDYVRENEVNTTIQFDCHTQGLECDESFNTAYLKKMRTVERLKANFITKSEELILTLESYQQGLFAENYLQDAANVRVIIKDKLIEIEAAIDAIKYQINNISKLDITPQSPSEVDLDEYRRTKIKLNYLLKDFLAKARDAMQFSPKDLRELFPKESTKTKTGIFGIFGEPKKPQPPSMLQKNLQIISISANKSLSTFGRSNS